MKPAFLFAPGAGAPSSHPWMLHWADLLGRLGAVETLDYPYMREGRKRPDPLPVLIRAHTEALQRLRQSHDGPAVLIGKSMGSRVGCHVSLAEPVAAVVCFGYPLCGGGDPSRLRDKVLLELTTPVLFIQGTRDQLCPLELLASVRGRMRAPHELHVVEEGDHSLLVTKRWLKEHGQTQDRVDETILAAIARFLTRHTAAPGFGIASAGEK
jgi:predicted alpha/beta-hydrolase family hydrolase